jgi:hypothetical protein
LSAEIWRDKKNGLFQDSGDWQLFKLFKKQLNTIMLNLADFYQSKTNFYQNMISNYCYYLINGIQHFNIQKEMYTVTMNRFLIKV